MTRLLYKIFRLTRVEPKEGHIEDADVANWRVIFRFEDGHACDVELIDYH